jgi:hypothetical protein
MVLGSSVTQAKGVLPEPRLGGVWFEQVDTSFLEEGGMSRFIGVSSRTMALVCGVVLIAGPVWGEARTPIHRLTNPVVSSMRQVRPPVKAAPTALTIEQRSKAVQSFLHLPMPPNLSAPFTVTPAQPVVPFIASLNIYAVGSLHTDMNNLQNGFFDLCNLEKCHSTVELAFRTIQGKRYAVDCAITSSFAPQYHFRQSSFGAALSSGTLDPVANNHFVFASGPAPTDDIMIAELMFYSQGSGKVVFYNCNVSSF